MSLENYALEGGEIGQGTALRPRSCWIGVVEAVAAALLAAIIVLLLLGVFSRYVLAAPLVWVDETASVCFLWLSMLGAAIAIERHEHLRLTIFRNALPERFLPFVDTLAVVLVATVLLALLLPAANYVREQAHVTLTTLGISMSYRAAAIVAGIALMLLITLRQIVGVSRLPVIALAVGVVVAIGAALWLLSPVLNGLGFTNVWLFLVGFAVVGLLLGVPIAFCFGVGTISFLMFSTQIPMIVVIGRMDEGMSNIVLLSVPIFVLLGCVLDATGMGKAIVNFMLAMLGHIKAGMSYVLLGSLFLVSGISGSKVSDMATVAPALFPEMKRRGSRPDEMIAQLATGAAMADTVPPSIVLIVLGSVAGISIASLFTSGLVVATVLLLTLAVLARWKARGENLTGVRRAPFAMMGRSFVIALPVLVLPVLIRAAVGGGVATATEVSTIAVLYAILIGAVLYGGITPRSLYAMLVETAALSGAVLLIMGTASGMAWTLTQTGFAFKLVALMTDLPGGWLSFMMISIVIYLVLGCVLEGLPAIVLMAPLMFPAAKAVGIHEIHYAMVMVAAMNIGLMAPPIGIGYYIACKIGDVSPDDAMRAIWPYLAALLVGLLLVATIPALTTAYL